MTKLLLQSGSDLALLELSAMLRANAEYRERLDSRNNAWFFLNDPPLRTGA